MLFRTTILYLFIISCSTKDTVKNLYNFPIEIVIQKSQKRINHNYLDSINLNNYTKIDSTFYKTWFNNLEITNYEGNLEFDPYSRYYFYDYVELNDRVLFSIIHSDEVCCNNLYHFTFDKIKKTINSIDFLASTGADGGQMFYDILDYKNNQDELILTSISVSDEDINEKYYSRQYDSTLTKIKFLLEKSNFEKISSYSKLDSIFTK